MKAFMTKTERDNAIGQLDKKIERFNESINEIRNAKDEDFQDKEKSVQTQRKRIELIEVVREKVNSNKLSMEEFDKEIMNLHTFNLNH